MKKLTSVAVAGAIAMASIGAAATTADAGQKRWKNWNQQYSYNHRNRGGDAGAFIAGGIIGLAAGVIASQAFQPYPYGYYPPVAQPVYPAYPAYAYANPHVAWCESKYISYNPQSNTWVDYAGNIRVCVSPY